MNPLEVRSAYLGSKEYMKPLINEIAGIIDVQGQLILSSAPPIRALWALNIWQTPTMIPIESINDGAKKLKSIQRNWCLYSYQSHRRAKLIQEKLPYISAKPLKFPCQPPSSSIGSWTLITPNQILASPKCSSLFQNGKVLFEEDKKGPPSRAYLKLYEVLTKIEKLPQPGEFCIDAGGSPGSWAWAIQKLGANVLSVDRSSLNQAVLSRPNVKYLKKDAFTIKPSEFDKVDWLFSDIICYPEKLFEWVSMWVESKKCNNFVSIIKFKGIKDYSIARKFLEIEGSQVTHLYNNKHELTWIKTQPTSQPKNI